MSKKTPLDKHNELTRKTIARRLNELYCERWKGTQSEFAERFDEIKAKKGYKVSKEGCQPQYISSWINGRKTPSDIAIECIAEILDVDKDYFTLPYPEDQASGIDYICKQDRQFLNEMKQRGIQPEFLEFIRSDDLFPIKFPFSSSDKKKIVTREDKAPSLKKYARVEIDGDTWDIDLTGELHFILELQDEVKKTIDRMYWDRFESLRFLNIMICIDVHSRMWGVERDIVSKIYTDNPDWFIRTKIRLNDQLDEDRDAMDDLMLNYAIDHKLERSFKFFEPEYTQIDPQLEKMYMLRHEDLDELNRMAREQAEASTRKTNEEIQDMVQWINEEIKKGTLPKRERRK